MSLLRTT